MGVHFLGATSLWLIENGTNTILKYIYEEIKSDDNYENGDFQPQEVVYASKHNHHLRRTHKLDPVAELFIYDIVYRNRKRFRNSFSSVRQSYGYLFQGGKPISSSESYSEYRREIVAQRLQYSYSISFDIAAYFNTLYHHDLSAWFEYVVGEGSDANIFSKFLRQINGGRSVDCLPHGLYPTKMIGSHFLKFVDNYSKIESPVLIRFMDDFTLFSNDYGALQRDFIQIQQLIGRRGLSVNSAKTKSYWAEDTSVAEEIDRIRLQLLEKKALVMGSFYDDDEPDIFGPGFITEEEENYLITLLDSPRLEEEDADLILTFLRDHDSDLLKHISNILWDSPYLSKNIYIYSQYIEDKSGLLYALLDFVTNNKIMSEYSLFWVTCILQDHLINEKGVERLVAALHSHPRSSNISKAKLLEIPDLRYGLTELREQELRNGSSNWLAWSSAVGCLAENKPIRNYRLKYFAKGSRINALIAQIITEK